MLQGKRALVVGVANARSIAWGIANRWRQEGAEVFITYQNERFRKPVEKLVRDSWGPYDAPGAPIPATACDVTDEEDIAQLWRTLQERGFCSSSSIGREDESQEKQEKEELEAGDGGGDFDGSPLLLEREGSILGRGRMQGGEPTKKTIDVILHSVAHAPTDAMRQGFLMGTTRDAFVSAHVVSAYSLVSTVRHALPFLSPGASVMALTYIGSQRQAAANYNVMGPAKASLESCARALAAELGGPRGEEGALDSHGSGNNPPGGGGGGGGGVGPGGVRVNCLSAGPVRTMAARGITGFDEMRREAAGRAPLGEGLAGVDEIAGVATFLASPLLSSAVTGQTVYADRGFSAVV
ncbi:unnamed protein product [Hapterophycus canaliculatus]